MSAPSVMAKRLVVILGCTGTGKSKLAIEIAKRFAGEVVSADSMQIYQGLDIITNKVTEEEAEGVKHHMMSYLPPLTLGHTVTQFRLKALSVLDDIWGRGKLPILVGGTGYYVESILWNVLIDDDAVMSGSGSARLDSARLSDSEDERVETNVDRGGNEGKERGTSQADAGTSGGPGARKESLEEALGRKLDMGSVELTNGEPGGDTDCGTSEEQPPGSSGSGSQGGGGKTFDNGLGYLIDALPDELKGADPLTLYGKLQEVDSARARQLHPNDFRRVTRALQVWYRTQSRQSDLISQMCEGWTDPLTLYAKLQQVDPVRTRQLHPNYFRRVMRALQPNAVEAERSHITGEQNTGTEVASERLPTSDEDVASVISNVVEAERSHITVFQKSAESGVAQGGTLRFPNTVVFWIDCDRKTLVERLNTRVIGMLNQIDCDRKTLVERLNTRVIGMLNQKAAACGVAQGGTLRFPNTVVFWIDCDRKTLVERLNTRVIAMLNQGLEKEITEFYDAHYEESAKALQEAGRTAPTVADGVKGIFQSIGFKEFMPFLKMSPEERTSPQGREVLTDSCTALQIATRQYARRQIRRTKGAFLQKPDRECPPLYRLDSTDLTQWDTLVRDRALSVLDHVILGQPPPEGVEPMTVAAPESPNENLTKYCDACGKYITGVVQWAQHVRTKKHWHMTKRLQSECKEPMSAEAVIMHEALKDKDVLLD